MRDINVQFLKHFIYRPMSNPFSKKADAEVAQTYAWIQTHLEEDLSVSLPKCEVYEEYRVFCVTNHVEPLCVADFGKGESNLVIKI